MDAPRAEETELERWKRVRSHKVIIQVTPRLLYDLIAARVEDIGQFAGASYDHDTDSFLIKVVHEKYPEVEEGHLIPRAELITDGKKTWVK